MMALTDTISSSLKTVPHLVKLAVAVALVQLVFWFLIKPLIIGTASPGFETLDAYEISHAMLEAPEYAALAKAEFEVLEDLPGEHCCEPGYRAFRYHFDLDVVPEHGLGIAPHVRTDNFRIYANGSFVAGTGRMNVADPTYEGMVRKIFHIQSEVVQSGKNEIVFILVRNGVPYFDYFGPVLGEYNYMKAEFGPTEFMSGPYSYLVFAAILMVAAFSLIFFLISRQDSNAFWLFSLAAGLALSAQYYIWIDPPFGGQARLAYFFLISMFVQYAWFGWADNWSRRRIRWMLPLVTLAFLILLLAALCSLYFLPYGPGYDQAGEILFYSGIVFAIATAARLLWNFRDGQEDRYLEAAIALLLVSLFALQAITELTQSLNLGYISRTQPFLILGVAIAFFARRVTLFRTSSQINNLLQSQLDERTGELALAHNREKHLVRQQALDEERQRIMRDMHDGLGSHLMSMLMMANRGEAKHTEYADGLQLVIDEMRLMIDSMDSVGESLRAALTTFKRRIVPRARSAGFTVNWNDQSGSDVPDYGPRDVLQIFRILQEAIANALKHSGGDTIEIDIERSGNAALKISVSDNGEGLAGALQGGRGLKNMHARADGLGAGFELDTSGHGVKICLTLNGRATA